MIDLNIIIFSFNRPCQLHACLSSLNKKNKIDPDKYNITVIYKAENHFFQLGYNKLMMQFSDINWVVENDFRQDTIRSLSIPSEFTMFLVDDIIFINDFTLYKNYNKDLLSISLRLHKNASYCYSHQSKQEVPQLIAIDKDLSCWDWKSSELDWGYPFSLDGNIYSTNLICDLISSIDFYNPNTLEGSMHNSIFYTNYADKIACYTYKPKLINIPTNRVQNTYLNINMSEYTAEELNHLFLNNKIIDTDLYDSFFYTSVHVPTKLIFKR
jgi:hypothetical protein